MTEHPIAYGYDSDLNEMYFNDSNTGSRGFEIEYKLKYSRFYTSFNYSYYESLKGNTVEYNIPFHQKYLSTRVGRTIAAIKYFRNSK